MNNSQFLILNSQLNYEELSALDKLCIGTDGWSAEDFRSEAEKDGGIVLAAYCGEKLVGLIAGFTAADTGEILTVATASEYRRQGAAKMLMEAFLDAVPEGVETIALEVRHTNAAAIALYESFGFERVGVRKRFYRDPIEDADVMVLNRSGDIPSP
ncbi:ribosomal protein S18-alanine N-acetyltransferase [Ruminococcus sp.]|uniref:ribosomal protein S18-alanine N-acetyltransferase n=1 Tax=Ruminococcus sp. TaxID=41978 RepID=UPI001B703D6E|nr:ribosomal protein S18-alanine N-acetyltransferase [Ruminococcus sp.]MBP5433431.1 ribosomal protein S18-alanine N-acetyltransferase [Ruminococcus sp.]